VIALAEPAPLDQWRHRFGGRRRQYARPRPAAALGYLTNGPVVAGLIEIQKLVLVVLYDEPDDHGRLALRLAGFCGAAVPWGVKWGGPEQSKFFKNLCLQPMPEAREARADLASTDLVRLGLHLDRELERHVRYRRRGKPQQLQLPRVWAGFRGADARTLTGDGPELAAHCRQTGRTASDLLQNSCRDHFGLKLLPLEWTSHHWQQVAAVFADLENFPRRQVFSLQHRPEELLGYHGAAEHDFYESRFRRPLGSPGVRRGSCDALPAAS